MLILSSIFIQQLELDKVRNELMNAVTRLRSSLTFNMRKEVQTFVALNVFVEMERGELKKCI